MEPLSPPQKVLTRAGTSLSICSARKMGFQVLAGQQCLLQCSESWLCQARGQRASRAVTTLHHTAWAVPNGGSWHRQHRPLTARALSVTACRSSEFISQMMPIETNSVRLHLKCKTDLVTICLYGIKLHCPSLSLAILL